MAVSLSNGYHARLMHKSRKSRNLKPRKPCLYGPNFAVFLQRAFVVVIATILQLQQLRCPFVLARAHGRALLSLDSGPGASQKTTVVGATTVQVRSGAQLASALADTSVQVAVVPVDIVLSAADWASHPVPVLLNHNFTILGAYEDQRSWPLLDLSFLRARVQLEAGGTVLKFSRVVIRQYRAAPQFQAQGFDLLASSNSSVPGSQKPLLLLQDAAIVHRICLPAGVTLTSGSSTVRPVEIPGTNQVEILPPFPGCVNSSSVPPMQRCWIGAGFYNDGALYATDMDMYGKPVPAGYLGWLLRSYYLCDELMSDECVEQFGPVGCYWRMAASGPGGMFPGNNTTSMTGPPPAPTLDLNGKKAAKSTLLAALLAGLLGGSAIVLAVAFILRIVRVPRRGRSADEELTTVNYVLTPSNFITEEGDSLKLGSEAAPSGCLDSGRLCAAEVQLIPVTWSTPVSSDINLLLSVEQIDATATNGTPDGMADGAADSSLSSCGGEIQLLKNVLGRGVSGRVVTGRYRGELVAVKLINAGLVVAGEGPQPAAAYPIGCKVPAVSCDADDGSRKAEEDRQQQRVVGLSVGAGAGAGAGAMAHQQLQTLAQEVAVLARCRHPNIVRLLAANLEPPRVCLVMELMETSLERLMYGGGAAHEDRLLPLSTVLHIATQIARALSYLHPTILHRDLKPGNVLISQAYSDQPVAKLADFGLSRFRMTTLPTGNPEVGTVPYMAPETFDVANYIITDRVDVYSFGVLLWEMLTGTRPWAGTTDVQIAVAVTLHDARLPVEEALLPAGRCPPKLRALIHACWEKDPARRPAAAEIVKALALVQEGLSASVMYNSKP